MFDFKFISKKSQEHEGAFFIAGCDEVGRGPLAGPVVAASTSIEVLNFDEKEIKALLRKLKKLGVNDSKKLSAEARLGILGELSFNELSANQIYTFQYSKNMTLKILIKELSAGVIDEINILQASLLAMKQALVESAPVHLPGVILVDGNKKLKHEADLHEQHAVVEGDAKSLLIGLSSIAAKVYRDQLMKSLGEKYPGYGWEQNAGYPTKMHLEAISLLGVTELHRLTFKGVKEVYAERGYGRGASL
ncbi:ribonuclease HII [Bacteriovorax stolpii]|uniref:ribonuclease HII n=1 Tax=Bacteriovorax stolpii TaxID=960 RepID=UPI0011572970|nr:ribonuclease HII [Bacteriovorax stolpii]QDK41473.1 ribonuclease HII [Bacteriovorax stolpii]